MRIEQPIWLSSKAAYRPVGPVYVTRDALYNQQMSLMMMFVCLFIAELYLHRRSGHRIDVTYSKMKKVEKVEKEEHSNWID